MKHYNLMVRTDCSFWQYMTSVRSETITSTRFGIFDIKTSLFIRIFNCSVISLKMPRDQSNTVYVPSTIPLSHSNVCSLLARSGEIGDSKCILLFLVLTISSDTSDEAKRDAIRIAVSLLPRLLIKSTRSSELIKFLRSDE